MYKGPKESTETLGSYKSSFLESSSFWGFELECRIFMLILYYIILYYTMLDSTI